MPPQGMSAEEFAFDIHRRIYGANDGMKSYSNGAAMDHQQEIVDFIAAARADERVKAWNEALEVMAKRHCLNCRGGVPLALMNDGRLWHKHPNAVSNCFALEIHILKLPEAPPVEQEKP